ncbi:MAG: PaaI family thioesterase [Gemmatimonadales bacterium]
MDRTRTVSWQDPASGREAAISLSGLEWLRAMANGSVPPPPLALLLGFQLQEIDKGRVTVGVEPAEFHYNPLGVVHGGLAPALFDTALGCAVQSLLPPAMAAPTMQLQINYLRPITIATGKLSCVGEVIHLGKGSAVAEGKLTDRDGKLYAQATGTFAIRSVGNRTDG